MKRLKTKMGLLFCSLAVISWLGVSGVANAAMYTCDNGHNLMTKGLEIVIDTVDVYLVSSYPKYQTYKGTKFSTLDLMSSDRHNKMQLAEFWSRDKGYGIMLSPWNKSSRSWDDKNIIGCHLSNPDEEPPAPPAELN